MNIHTLSFIVLFCLLISGHSYSVAALETKPGLVQKSTLVHSVSPAVVANKRATKPLLTGTPAFNNIQGKWNIVNINGKPVKIKATITNNAILFTYSDKMSYPYVKTDNNIKIRSNWTTLLVCNQMANGLYPPEVNQTFVDSTIVQLIGNTLVLKNSAGQEKVRMTRQVAVKSGSKDNLKGNWNVFQIRGKGVNVQVTFSGSTISYKYCNGKSMKYSTGKGGSIKITPGTSTKMACPNLSPSEGEFDSAFTSAVRYTKQGNSLRLYDQTGAITANLKLRKSSKTPPIPSKPGAKSIAGVWTTTNVGDKKLSIAVNITKVSLLFSYCNSYSYPLSVSGNKITLGAPASTKVLCANMNPPESFVSGTFSSATSYKIIGRQLVFYNGSGQVVVRMNKGNTPKPISKPNRSKTPTQSIVGDWFTTSVKGNKVLIKVNITGSDIRYNYCNAKTLPYKSSGSVITVSSGLSTVKHCEGLKPTEGEVDNAFLGAKSFKVSGNQLNLFDKSGNMLVTLEREIIYKITPVIDKQVI